MDFKELTYVIAVGKYENITKASKALFISQPSLSKYIKNLEANLGLKLFNRLGNRFVLTYAGTCYVENAKEILRIKEKLTAQLEDISNLQKGKLNIAMPTTRGSYMIPSTIPKFKELYPNVQVNLIENYSSNLEDLLLNGDADIAILNTPITNKDLDYEVLGNEEIVLVVSKNHPLASSGKKSNHHKFPWIDIHNFKNDRFIMQYPTQRTGQIGEKIFKDTKFKPKEIFYTRNLEASVKMAIDNFGLCFISEYHLKHMSLSEAPNCFSIGNKSINFELVVAFRRGSYLPSYAKDYIKIVKGII